MEFIHELRPEGATIAAIITAPGEGAVAIIRISGYEALQVADRIFSRSVFAFQSHTAHLGDIIDEEGCTVDQVLLLVMLKNRSFTGEDTVEIHCHGGSLIARRVLELAIHAGALPAEPGEFSKKAFLNGKIDLAQAEAIQQLIASKNLQAMDMAKRQLDGSLSKMIKGFQKELTVLAAILEAWVDFPEEGLEFTTEEKFLADLQGVIEKMQSLLESYHDGKLAHDGVSLCLLGEPNVGKSSLLNVLLRKERAIVTPIAGTTRDTLEEEMRLNNLHVKLIDTAGVRQTDELIEKEGIKRSFSHAKEADLILVVVDVTLGLTESFKEVIKTLPQEKIVIVFNKCDLPSSVIEEETLWPRVLISAKDGHGIDDLKKMVVDMVWKGTHERGDVVLTKERHRHALDQSIRALNNVKEGLNTSLSPEFMAMDMRHALEHLGQIIGTNVSDDILSEVFSTFCIGK